MLYSLIKVNPSTMNVVQSDYDKSTDYECGTCGCRPVLGQLVRYSLVKTSVGTISVVPSDN